MKKHIIVLSLLLIFVGIYGWRLVHNAISSYNTYTKTNEQLATAQNEYEDLSSKITERVSTLQDAYKVVQEGAYYDFCNEFVQSNYTIVQISTKKLSNNATTTIASYNSVDEVHGATNADLLEITFSVEDLNVFLSFLESNNYAVDKLLIYPTDNMVVVTFLVGGDISG